MVAILCRGRFWEVASRCIIDAWSKYILHIAGILHVKTKQIVFYKGGKKKRRLQFSSSLIFMCLGLYDKNDS